MRNPELKALAAGVVVCTCCFGQAPYVTRIEPAAYAREISPDRGSAALWQSLKKLHTRASLIMITAHPDDEDGGLLAYESRGRGTRVDLLTLNRGEGGANVMSSDFFDALGLVRTMELLEAGRYYGVEQHFTRVVDYGFSKTKAESIRQWTHDRVLGDVVRVVRMTRPLVVASVFIGGPTDGHGNHETAGAMAQEVFRAAADPSMFPEQIQEGLRPWAPVKQYARTPWFGKDTSGLTVNVSVPEGTYDPILGCSYAQLSRDGLGQQKTQNGGPVRLKAGPVSSTYHRFQSRIAARDKEDSFFDGIDTSLEGIAQLAGGSDSAAFLVNGLRAVNGAVEDAISKFDAAHPERTADALALGLRTTSGLVEETRRSGLSDTAKYNVLHELEIKRTQFNNALAEALGLTIDATLAPERESDPAFAMFFGDAETPRVAFPGETVGIKVHVAAAAQARLKSAWVDPKEWVPDRPQRVDLGRDRVADLRFTVQIPTNAPLTRPYFSRPDIEQSYYDISEKRFLTKPLPPFPMAAWAEFEYEGLPIRVAQYVQTVKRVAGLGSVYEPLVLAPAISVAITPKAGIVPLATKSFPVTVQVLSNMSGPASGTVRLGLPDRWSSEPASERFELAQPGQVQNLAFNVRPEGLSSRSYIVTALAECDGKQYREGYETTGYPGLRTGYLYSTASYRTAGVDVTIAPGLRIGYVEGSGDDVPESMQHLGLHPAFLSPSDIATGDLSKFGAIVLGVRAYAVRDDLKTHNDRILEYVKNGGVLIVQYNTPEYDRNYGPYPYEMGSDPEEVTDERSKVEILQPSNPVFQWPNRITEKDFEGWVEERGSKWMRRWDPRWEALLETHDEGQEPQKGGFLYARYGRGVYIYNAYALYRQLPEGVPGAYRIFANLVSLAKNPYLAK